MRLRSFLSMIRESDQLGIPDWYEGDHNLFFWYHPGTQRYVSTDDSTHTLAAIEDMGYQKGSDYDANELEDYELMGRVIQDGWVRVGISVGLEDADSSAYFMAKNFSLIRQTGLLIIPKLNFEVVQYSIEIPGQHLKLTSEQMDQFLKGRTRFVNLQESELPTLEQLKQELTESSQHVDLYYHGTSSKFWPSIEKQGLVPNPQKRVYGAHHGLESFPGIYLAASFDQAMTASLAAVNRFGGDSLILGVQVDLSKSLIDEDRVWDFFDNYLLGTDHYVREFFKRTIPGLVRDWSSNRPGFREMVIKKMLDDFEAFFGKTDPSLFGQYLDMIFSTMAQLPDRQKTMIGMGTIREHFSKSRDVLEQIMDRIPGHLGTDNEENSVRVTQPIGFQGMPRIVWAITVSEDEEYNVIFGKPPRQIMRS